MRLLQAIPLHAIASLATGLAISACGGGAAPSGAVAPEEPVVTATMSSARVTVGGSVTLSWSSTGATGCGIAELGLTGLAPAGSMTFRPTAGGVKSYTVACRGAGGAVSKALSLAVPLPVQRTSYLNAKYNGELPRLLPAGGNARGFADFEQSGALSYVVHTLEYTPPNTVHGHVRMYRLNDDGSSTDITAQLIDGDNTGCLHPRKALVADFNGDRRPDVFFSCHGWDSADPPPPGTPLGEFPVILLSQPNGHYVLTQVTFAYPGPRLPYLHSATAVDVDGSGFASIVVADVNANTNCESPLYVLRNNRDGSFTRDTSNFPDLANRNGLCQGTAVWSVELLDLLGDGTLQLWAAGQDNPTGEAFGGLQSSAYAMTGDMQFAPTASFVFPVSPTRATPLDITVRNGAAYFVRVGPAYDSYELQRVDLTSLSSSVVFTNTTDFGSLASTRPECIGYGGAWVDFIHITAGGLAVTDDSCRSPNVSVAP